MGGYGSGPGPTFSKKTTVEECHDLTARAFKPFMNVERDHQLTMTWTRGEEKEVVGTISFRRVEDREDPDGRAFRFIYTVGRGDAKRAADYLVRMVKVRPHFGGGHWHFLCPLVVNGRPCGRRAAKLYLPPGGLYFGCRTCYGLTYTSCRESHKFDALLKAMAADLGQGMTARKVKDILGEP